MEILFEDKDIIVVHKPYNIPTQTAKLTQKDLISELKSYLRKSVGKEPYLGIIHRLDQNVEGLLVFGKTKKAAAGLSEQLSKDHFNKDYIAKVSGIIPEGKIELEDFLFSEPKTNVVKVVSNNTAGAKKSVLIFEKWENDLIIIHLKTGRKHQIRVQLSNAGLPIVGDKKYGNGTDSISNRLCLLAYHLSFKHPVSGESLDFTLPLSLTKEW